MKHANVVATRARWKRAKAKNPRMRPLYVPIAAGRLMDYRPPIMPQMPPPVFVIEPVPIERTWRNRIAEWFGV